MGRILAHLADGMPYDTACLLESVWPTSLDERKNADPELALAVAVAMAKAESKTAKTLQRLTEEGERTGGAEFTLRARYPSHWNPPKQTEVSGPGGGPQVIHHRLEAVSVQRLARGDDE